jgi:DNA-binding Xre family transcriptional regulator
MSEGNLYKSPYVVIRIKNVAKIRKIAIKEILETAGLGINALSHMNHGRAISFDSLAKIADALDVSVDYLLGRTDKMEVNR